MNDYAQPEFFRFGRDSLELVRFVLRRTVSCRRLLDLCAGCGVVGIELAKSLTPERLTMVELQSDWEPFLAENLAFLPALVTPEIVLSSLGKWEPREAFDLIVCNPPYYLPGRGEPSKDPRRSLARTFSEDGWEMLLTKIERALSEDGRAHLVLKNEASLLREVRRALGASSLRSELFPEGDLVFLVLSRGLTPGEF